MAKVKRGGARRIGRDDLVKSVSDFTLRGVALSLRMTGPLFHSIPKDTLGLVRGRAPGTHKNEKVLWVDFEYDSSGTVSVEINEEDLVLV